MIRRRKNSDEVIDEHDQPTEPMYNIVISSFAPTMPDGTRSSGDKDPSLAQPDKQSFREPPHPVQITTTIPPTASNRRFTGTAAPTPAHNGRKVRHRVQTRQSRVPIFVGVFFVAVQLLLLVRAALKVMTIPDTTPWVAAVYSVSTLFVYPFQLLAHYITVPFPIEVYTLLAILVYGLCSRILVRFLKALLNAR